jgi:hypothetical protein
LLLPDSAASFTNVETLFRWVPVDGAESYQIEVGTDPRFEDGIVDAGLVGGTFYRSFRLRANTAYFWRVVAQSSAGLGVWSNVWPFSTSPVDSSVTSIVLLSPDSGAVFIEAEPATKLSWRSSACASVYDVEIATSSDFDSASMVDQAVVKNPPYISDALSSNRTYFWRIFGRDSSCLAKSSTWVFSTGGCLGPDRVMLTSPSSGETVSVITTFTWEDLGNVHYEIEVSPDSTFRDRSIAKTEVTDGTQWSRFLLLPAQRYYWRVRAFTECGSGDWSAVRKFTTRDEPPRPQPPVLESPSDGEQAVSTIATLVLRSGQPVDSFRVQLADEETFLDTVIDTVINTPRLRISSPLANDSFYFWRAQARNAAGYSIWSPTSRFKTILYKARFNEAVRENRLAQNHPNPFNPSTTIEFEIKDASYVSLFVFDVRGRKVATLVESPFGEGAYQVTWDGRFEWGTPAPSGLYLYRIVTDDFTMTKRMVLIK